MQVCAFLLNSRRLCRVLQNVTYLLSASLRTICSRRLANLFMIYVARSPLASLRSVGTLLPFSVGFLFLYLQQTNEIEQHNQEKGTPVSYSYSTQRNLKGPNAVDMEIRKKETRYHRPIQSLFSRFFLCSPLSLKY